MGRWLTGLGALYGVALSAIMIRNGIALYQKNGPSILVIGLITLVLYASTVIWIRKNDRKAATIHAVLGLIHFWYFYPLLIVTLPAPLIILVGVLLWKTPWFD